MTGYDDPTKPKRPAPLPGQPTEKPEPDIPPLGPTPTDGDKPDPTIPPLGPGTYEKPDTPQWGYSGTGNPEATTNTVPAPAGNPAAATNDVALGNPTDPQVPTVGGAAPAVAPGWEDAGNGMVRNPETGQMLPTNHPDYQRLLSSAAPTTAPVPSDGGGVIPGSAAPTAAPAAADSPLNTSFKDALMKMLSDNQAAPTLTDPALKGQADAFSLSQTRARERARSALAERSSAQGGSGVDSGVFDQGLVGLDQAQGEAEGSFNAGLVGQELQQRRSQLMQAATLAGNQLTAEQQMALQKQLADVDAAIKREGLAQQGSQFSQTLTEQQRQSGIDAELKRLGIDTQGDLGRQDIELRRLASNGQLSLGLLQLLTQDRQFGQNLGANIGMFNSGQNQTALLQMLGQLGG